MVDAQYKRNVAYKLRIGEILIGNPVMDNDKFMFLELGNKQIARVNIIGNVIDKYNSEGEKRYSFLTLDDGSGQIKIKAFSDDVLKTEKIQQGQTILVIGLLKNFNNETYISPEILKPIQPEYLLLRKLEIEKEKTKMPSLKKEEIVAVKDTILEMIKSTEPENGIDAEKIIMQLRTISPDIINQEIHKMLEDGIIFEPRPGRLRWLG